MNLFTQANELIKHINLFIFFGIVMEIIFTKSFLNFKGLICYFQPTIAHKPLIKAIDLIIYSTFLSILGDIILEPNNPKQCIVSGFSIKYFLKNLIIQLKSKEAKNEK